jgi:hypothetical protein
MGQFDLYFYTEPSQTGSRRIAIVPRQVTNPGEIATITVLNKVSFEHRTIMNSVVLQSNATVAAGTLSQVEVGKYDVIAITSYQPGVSFPQATPVRSAICMLPTAPTEAPPGQAQDNVGLAPVTFCDGTMGQFDLYYYADPSQAGSRKITIIPRSLDLAGDVATVTVVNKVTFEYKSMVNSITLQSNAKFGVGTLSHGEVAKYNVIAITSYQPGVNFLTANPARSAICMLPADPTVAPSE